MVKILVYQGRAAFADPAANLATIAAVAGAARMLGADVAVFPELFVTGYNLGDRLTGLAEPRDGPAVETLCAHARAHRLALVVGFCERHLGDCHNSAVAIDASGAVAAVHRKVQLFGPDEHRVFRPGDGFSGFDFLGHRCGLSICYDIEFPEAARALARDGVGLVFNPTANMDPYVEVPTTLVRARALENGMTIAYANHCGSERQLTYTGGSCIVGPDGRDLARAGREAAILVADAAPGLAGGGAFPLSTQLHDLRDPRGHAGSDARRQGD